MPPPASSIYYRAATRAVTLTVDHGASDKDESQKRAAVVGALPLGHKSSRRQGHQLTVAPGVDQQFAAARPGKRARRGTNIASATSQPYRRTLTRPVAYADRPPHTWYVAAISQSGGLAGVADEVSASISHQPGPYEHRSPPAPGVMRSRCPGPFLLFRTMPALEEITYEAGRAALADQESLVSGIRQRTGTLLAAHALVASFLGATTVRA